MAQSERWTPLPQPEGRTLYRVGPTHARAALIFFPGANCDARRYGWLEALTSPRRSIYLLEPAPRPGFTLCGIADVVAAIDAVRPHHDVLIAGGHSAGAAALMDCLDPASALTPRDGQPEGFAPPQDIAGLAVMGCSLQTRMLDRVLPSRSEDRPLSRPNNAPMLFLSGDHDRIAPPALMGKTRGRFRDPTELVVIPGAGHYGWVDGHAPTDRPDFDAPGAIAPDEVQRATLAALSSWMADRRWA